MESRSRIELQHELQRALDAERQRSVDLTVALRQLEEAQQIVEQTSRLVQELEIASQIQSSILPPVFRAPGLDIAARMRPAGEVGGDYYDVQPVDGACWFGIGDVAGHGLTAGVIMLMIQSIAAALIHASPDANPSDMIGRLNRVLYDNVRNRLRRNEHATLTLLRVSDRGVVTCAGAHQDVIIRRAGAATCECISIPGTWVGVLHDVQGHTPDASWTLNAGDMMVLYTDGITEAVDSTNCQFGPDRLCDAIASLPPHASAADVVQAAFSAVDAFAPWHDDDATLLAIRRTA